MAWGVIVSLFLLSTIKFMFAPLGGPDLGLSFFETYITCVAGGVFSSAVFYFSSGFFIKRAQVAKLKKRQEMIEKGVPFVEKKKFTKMNKFTIRLKAKIGIIGITFWGPFFLSVPIGSIIAAKFYNHKKMTYPLIVLGMVLNGLLTTGLAYLIRG